MYFYQQHHEVEPSVITPAVKPPKLFHAKNTNDFRKRHSVVSNRNEMELDQEDFEKLLESRVRSTLLFLGFNPKNKGFGFAVIGVINAYKNPLLLNDLSKSFYPLIAKQSTSTGSRIERCVRHELENCFYQSKLKNINSLFGMEIRKVDHRLSNGVFFSLLVQYFETEIGSYKRVSYEFLHHHIYCIIPF